MSSVKVDVVQLPHAADLPLPEYATVQSAAVDLLAAVTEDVVLTPGARTLIPTGLAIALPDGYEAQVRPRSGLALKNGITLLNTPGTIDADYRGEIGIILTNLGQEDFTVERGMRIAQMLIVPVTRLTWNAVSSLDKSERGSGRFRVDRCHHGIMANVTLVAKTNVCDRGCG